MYKKASENGALKWSIYYGPLHPSTWIVAIVLILCLTTGYILSSSVNKEEETNYFMGIHGLVLQGPPNEPVSKSAKILVWSLFVTGWLLWASHSATLSSLLAVKIDKPPFINLLDMLKNTDYKIMFTAGGGELEQFKVFCITFFLKVTVMLLSCAYASY